MVSAGHRSLLRFATLLLVAAAFGCDDGPHAGPAVAQRPEWTPARSAAVDELAEHLQRLPDSDGIVVRLAFGPAADLDLYVTGPREEAVYYANTPSKIGGELVEDQRCVHAGTRIEEIRFPVVPGRYRVGVDYPRACGETRLPAPYSLRLDLPAGRRDHRAIAVHQVFEPVVFEFDVAAETNSEEGR